MVSLGMARLGEGGGGEGEPVEQDDAEMDRAIGLVEV